MRNTFNFFIVTLAIMSFSVTIAQDVNVDVNLNIKHSVDGVSDFGRERHITVHSAPTERDWTGHEDMLDYFINDLDVYFGRDNGSASWKNRLITEDPNRLHWPDTNSIATEGIRLKQWYESDDFSGRHQYEDHARPMIMGMNPAPVYPTMDWANHGKTNSGWQSYDVDAAAFWIAHYLDKNLSKSEGDIGEPLPKYWECINEPDMDMMGWNYMMLTSPEKLFEFHNLCAIEIRNLLGDDAPLVGGMTWGLHDMWGTEWNGSRIDPMFYYDNSTEDIFSAYDNMWLGADGLGTRAEGSTIWQHNKDSWWQWDGLWQSFIDAAGENMDFYSIHIYDWPQVNEAQNVIRAGGHTEAMLDLIEWYDMHKFNDKKDIVVSEFGSVGPGVSSRPYKRRDWENLRPFNQMFMQFLERPSHLVLTMPFAPVKAQWGDSFDANGNLSQRYSVTMMDPLGDYRENAPGERYNHSNWEWSNIILWYELWSDVNGTRIDTKSEDRDIQVDAYVDGSHVYLILNNLELTPQDININLFDDYDNAIKSVKIKHQYLNESLGSDGLPVNDITIVATAPGTVTLAKSATMILDYEFENPVTIDQESKEYKYMGNPLTTSTNTFGSQLCHVEVGGRSAITANVNGVNVPTIGEATLRIGLRTWANGNFTISINGHSLLTEGDPVDWRGQEASRGGYGWFGVLELDIPLEYLETDNAISCTNNGNKSEYSSVQIQVWDFTTEPNRTSNSDGVDVTGIALGAPISVMNGQSEALAVEFTPTNATQKGISWNSSNPSVATVDEFGIVTALASSGTTTITATSTNNPGATATQTITAIPYSTTSVTGISIAEGLTTEVEYYVTTQLNAVVEPANATEQTVVWSSADETIVSVDSVTGKVMGISIGESTTITATLTDPNNSNAIHTETITVTVKIRGEESIYCSSLPEYLIGNDTYTIDVRANVADTRNARLELIQDGTTVLGTNTVIVDNLGEVTFPVTLDLAGVPAIGTNYTLKATLLDGASAISGCESPVTILDIIHVDSISFTDWQRKVQVNSTIPITAIVLPENAFNKKINWTSDNNNIATVDENGIVTGVSAGTVKITATTQDLGLFDTVSIFVQSAPVVEEPVEIKIVDQARVFPLETYTFEIEFIEEWATEREVEWESSNDLFATIDENGVLTAGPAEGEVEITVTSLSSPSVYATCNFSVSNTFIVEAEDFVTTGGTYNGFVRSAVGINNNQVGDWADYTVDFPLTGEYSISYYTGAPATSTNIAANLYIDGALHSTTSLSSTGGWDTYEPFKGTVLIPVTAGVHTIRIESEGSSNWQWNMDKFELTYQGSVDVEGVLLTEEKITKVGMTRALEAIIYPSSAINKNVTWNSINSGIASVNSSGEITGVSEGTTKVYVTTEEGGFTDTCLVTVDNSFYILVEEITIEPESLLLSVGDTKNLTATILPADAENKTVTWTSGNNSVATVNNAGLVTAIANGSTTITAAANDTSGVSKQINVKVSDVVIIEAEDLVREGGSFSDGSPGGSGINVVDGVGINYVNDGDWAEYSLDIPSSGIYKITYYISSPNSNANITCLVDGNQLSAVVVPNNGKWDDYQPVIATDSTKFTKGNYTFRIQASGADWQWNLDKIEFLKIRSLGGDPGETGIDNTVLTNVVIYPNPATKSISISGLSKGIYNVNIINTQGVRLIAEQIEGTSNTAILIDALPLGIYIMQIQNEYGSNILRFIKE